MNSRRDFLKIALLGTGTTFLGAALGCNEGREATPLQKMNGTTNVPPGNLPKLQTSGQRSKQAHMYLRQGGRPSAKAGETKKCDVVVLGSGPSGLSSARLLQKQGYDVLIVENEARPGGAAVSGEWRNVRYPLGSVYYVTETEMMREFSADAGVLPVKVPEDAIYLEGKFFSDIWSDRTIQTFPLSALEKSEMKRFRDELLKMDVPEYPLKAKLTSREAELDLMTTEQFLQKYRSPFLQKLMDLYSLSAMGAHAKETNAYCFLNFYASEFGDGFGIPRYTFAGGLNRLTQGIANIIGSQYFLYEHVVLKVENTASGVLVECINSNDELVTIEAKTAVVAFPKYISQYVVPEMGQEQRNAAQYMQYAPYATITLCSDRELMPPEAFDVWMLNADPHFSDIISPHLMYPKAMRPEGAYVYTLYSPLPRAQRSLLLSDESFANFAREAADKATRTLGIEAQSAIKEIQCFAWGHSIVIPTPGSHNGPAQIASQPIRNIYFAHTDNDASPAIESAMAHGAHAAEQIMNRFKGKRGF
ncbi:MAG TPA: FAD-dependent oxidoreductase [Patescibacteria group bacterium]|nr:FAD-dependent oxidoreductase [Patescibacteria group bacterium]